MRVGAGDGVGQVDPPRVARRPGTTSKVTRPPAWALWLSSSTVQQASAPTMPFEVERDAGRPRPLAEPVAPLARVEQCRVGGRVARAEVGDGDVLDAGLRRRVEVGVQDERVRPGGRSRRRSARARGTPAAGRRRSCSLSPLTKFGNRLENSASMAASLAPIMLSTHPGVDLRGRRRGDGRGQLRRRPASKAMSKPSGASTASVSHVDVADRPSTDVLHELIVQVGEDASRPSPHRDPRRLGEERAELRVDPDEHVGASGGSAVANCGTSSDRTDEVIGTRGAAEVDLVDVLVEQPALGHRRQQLVERRGRDDQAEAVGVARRAWCHRGSGRRRARRRST